MDLSTTTNTSASIPGPRCCCGSADCPYLEHNGKLLDGLERDVSKAAQLGQALLVRHEAYVADSERERRQMTCSIDRLEKEKLELEEKNAQTIKANRHLLDQLEQLNDEVATSDAHVKALTDTLHSTEEEIQRLSALAARTQNLERQLIELEKEQSVLQSNLDDKVADERTAMQRWRRAEKTIGDLQDQIDRIEKEAHEERERHGEIVTRMERRMAVNGELAAAAGRLKAKAGHEKGGTNVVSHFVKDILLDNTNLQHGILELREMLLCSNEEVERLRDQLRAHQPVSPDASPKSEDAATPTNLKNELGKDSIFNQELHIHHHYHGPQQAKHPKTPANRRLKKKYFNLTPGHFTPSVSEEPTSQSAILSQTAVTVPKSYRLSNATTLAPSMPGSPQSTSHRESIYDRVFSDVTYDSSRPTSPSDSVDIQSPMFEPSRAKENSFSQIDKLKHQPKKSLSLKPPSLATIRSVSTPISMTTKSSPASAIVSTASPSNSLADDVFTLSPSLNAQSTIPEENEDALLPTPRENHSLASPNERLDDEDLVSPLAQSRPSLRRPASHESLISVSGMDIHTLQSRPSQLLYSGSPHFSTPGGAGSVGPELSPWTATATANMSRRQLDSSTFNRTLLHSTMANQKRSTSSGSRKSEGLGKKVGGWVFGKWGATPTPASQSATSSPRPPSAVSAETQNTLSSQDTAKRSDAGSGTNANAKKEAKGKEKEVKLRPAGVNQSGPIWGVFNNVPPAPTKVVVTDLDTEALGDALGET